MILGNKLTAALHILKSRNFVPETVPITESLNALDDKPPQAPSSSVPVGSGWHFNKTLSKLIRYGVSLCHMSCHSFQFDLFVLQFLCFILRKNILKFLDAERDISILKGILKPGDVIHYIFDRHSTMNVSDSLYQLLPTVSPMKNQYHKRCAIVGNSGILLNSSCGPEIDSHDFVIR